MSISTLFTTCTQHVTSAIRRFGRIPLLIVLLWAVTLWWGERTVFSRSAAACEWHLWESWPADASPHHVLFVADPQLVDPHTYPGRPWPLSTLTVLYTDLYLRRIYGYLLAHTQPHTTLFLGDLFDGGREWAAADYESPEQRYKQYGTNFWLKEYNRFMQMFIDGWYRNKWDEHMTGEGRRIIASLPGNHDLGFAGGINEHVRNRFEAHFGPTNRIDILGNHTFVSLDTVSLSAMDQVDPRTGSSGAGDGTGHDTKHMEIWKPIEHFLGDVKNRRAKAVQRRYQYIKSVSEGRSSQPKSVSERSLTTSADEERDTDSLDRRDDVPVPSSNFPTILLTHVPLYRNQDVTCGPFRERGDAIPLSAGYQYQNVLTPAVSNDIVDHLDAEQVTMIYSGDDHDYCEIEHGEFTGRIKEITVKSMSWAMGVRKPGVQLASLWNPINMDAIARSEAPTSTPRDTVQNHLCLLPDQLAIFMRYGLILALTIVLLLARAISYNPKQAYQPIPTLPSEKENSQPLLPLANPVTTALAKKYTPFGSPAVSPHTKPVSTPKLHPHGISTPYSRSRSINRSTHDMAVGDINKLSAHNSNNNLHLTEPYDPSPRSMSPIRLDHTGGTDDWGMPRPGANVAQVQPTYQVRKFASFSHFSFPKAMALVDERTAHRLHVGASGVEWLIHGLITPAKTKVGEFVRSMTLVAWPVMSFYFWLLWNG